MSEIKQILNNGTPKELRALFGFTIEDENKKILLKFNLWSRYFFIQYFDSDDAEFHEEIDNNNLRAYKGEIDSYTDAAFRGASKTSRTKLFLAFCILNDFKHSRKYIKVLSADGDNSRQIVTDIYNMFVNPRVWALYPEIFAQTDYKREERMSSFTTSTGIKVLADTVGTEARGALQENSRPDLILFEDFETRKTLRSAKITKAIWDNMEEARTSLALRGAVIYNCNYISEMGNVHILVGKRSDRRIVSIIPIIKNGVLTWPQRYTFEDIEEMRKNDDDFEGERLCQPSASRDIIFDRESLDKMEVRQPVREVAGLKLYKEFNASHRYASGHDVAGGVGLDSSTSVFIDFDVIPCKVVGTFANNLIKPDTFGDEINRQSSYFGDCLACPERNNHGHATIGRLKQLKENIWRERKGDTRVSDSVSAEYGWHTNAATKPKMIFALAKAVEDGQIELSDEQLIQECKSYSRNDLIDTEIDPRLTTRHFDLLVAAAIAWQMKDYAQVKKEEKPTYPQEELKPIYSDIGI